MPKVSSLQYGTFLDAVCLRTGAPYSDWRTQFAGRPGMIVICEPDEGSGEKMIYFYSNDQQNGVQPFFRTSAGILVNDPPYTRITTNNSTYIFEIGDSVLTARDKQELFRNVFLSPTAWLYGMDAAQPK